MNYLMIGITISNSVNKRLRAYSGIIIKPQIRVPCFLFACEIICKQSGKIVNEVWSVTQSITYYSWNALLKQPLGAKGH